MQAVAEVHGIQQTLLVVKAAKVVAVTVVNKTKIISQVEVVLLIEAAAVAALIEAQVLKELAAAVEKVS
tara:strand:+ start:444 stop:650 length:207 start_codon:yes stop_codon:yes gene_type:complete